MYFYKNFDSPVGVLMIIIKDESIVELRMKNQKYCSELKSNELVEKENDWLFDLAISWLKRYFNGERPDINELPLAPSGSEFRQKVWKILCEIPYGKVIAYGDIAKRLGDNMSAQAVGGAIGHNPIPIIIPCHRVVGANANLTGFSGGIDKKIKLLEIEGFNIADFIVPTKGTAL